MATDLMFLTAEEYMRLPDDGRFDELVRGEVVEMARPALRHGEICVQITYLVRRFLEDHPVGRVISNDSGVVTERSPDTVRGPDVAYFSYANYPKGPMPRGYAGKPPEVVFEVRPASDRWPDIEAKAAEYLTAGVAAVCVADESTQSVTVIRPTGETMLSGIQELTLPELHAAFRVTASRLFD